MAPISLLEALQLVLGVAQQNPAMVRRPVDRYVLTTKKLASLTAAELPGARNVLSQYLAEVQPHFDRLVELEWLERLQQLGAAEAALNADPDRPVADAKLPLSPVSDMGRRLRVPDTATFPNQLGFQLLDGTTAVADLTTVALGKRGFAELRNADNVCIRILAAQSAADLLGVPVAEVLALYRTEGDLQVPISATSALRLIPATESRPASSLSDGLSDLIRELVFLADAPGLPEGQRALKALGQALVTWLLQLAGLDHLTQRVLVIDAPVPELARFSAANAARVPAAATLGGTGQAEQRWTDLLASLSFTLIRPTEPRQALALTPTEPEVQEGDAVLVAPSDPVKFVAGVLAEGAAFFRRLGTADDVLGSDGDTPVQAESDAPDLPAGHPLRGEPLDPGFAYFRYNLQVGALAQDGKPPQPWQAGMISAVAAAAQTKDARFKDLRASIAGSDKLKDIAEQKDFIKQEANSGLIKDLWWSSHLAPALRDQGHPERLRQLAEFVGTAGSSQWRTWTEPRGNARRYLQLLNFYERLEQL